MPAYTARAASRLESLPMCPPTISLDEQPDVYKRQVYVYDPAARTVQKVLGGVAGASGLALSRDGSTLFVADLGNRCVWSTAADARDLTAGGKNCQSFVSGLPGYPGALAMDADRCV